MQSVDVTTHIGSEVVGVQLTSATDERIQQLTRLVAERGVLMLRDQEMTVPEQVELGARFGPLHIHSAADAAPGHPEAMQIFTSPESTFVAGETWHSDVSCDEFPPALSILHMEEVPPTGGDTLWASTYVAFETLSPPIQQLLEGLNALHTSAQQYTSHYGAQTEGDAYPEAIHPAVATHPLTQRRALYVNRIFTKSLLGLRPPESDALLKFLFDHVAYGVEFQVRMRWEPHSVAIWDNRCTQHHATWDYYPLPRRGHRVTTRGARPVLTREPATAG